MSNDSFPPSNRPIVYTPPPSGHWGPSLVITCLALGFALSWGSYELRYRLAEKEAADAYRHEYDVLSAQQSDIGRLLADPRTKFVRLMPTDASTPADLAAVAWNDQRHSGVVFWDGLSSQAPRRYQLWLIPASGAATPLAFGPTSPGQDVYMISTSNPAPPTSQFTLTRWSSAEQLANATPALAHGTME